MAVREVSFEEVLELSSKSTKLVWLGNEPADYISQLLDLPEGTLKEADPNSILFADKNIAKEYKDAVFICHHGNTSLIIANALKERFDVDSYSMKGGVASVVGEIF